MAAWLLHVRIVLHSTADAAYWLGSFKVIANRHSRYYCDATRYWISQKAVENCYGMHASLSCSELLIDGVPGQTLGTLTHLDDLANIRLRMIVCIQVLRKTNQYDMRTADWKSKRALACSVIIPISLDVGAQLMRTRGNEVRPSECFSSYERTTYRGEFSGSSVAHRLVSAAKM